MLNDGCSGQSVDSLYYGMYLLTRHYCMILAIDNSSINEIFIVGLIP
jgi:hypothetical protein